LTIKKFNFFNKKELIKNKYILNNSKKNIKYIYNVFKLY